MSSYSWPPDEMYLILEEVGFAWLRWTERPEDNLFVDRRELFAGTRKEARDHREAVGDGRRIRGPEPNGLPCAGQPVDALCVRALPSLRPQHV